MMRVFIAMLVAILAVTLVNAQDVTQNQVIFSAGKTDTVTVNVGEVIKLDKVFINIGNGYDPATGIFECTEDGVYWLSVYAIGKPVIDLSLIKNSKKLVSVWGYIGTTYASGSNSIITPLRQGDKVFVRANKVSEMFGFSYASFSGYKLPYVKTKSFTVQQEVQNATQRIKH